MDLSSEDRLRSDNDHDDDDDGGSGGGDDDDDCDEFASTTESEVTVSRLACSSSSYILLNASGFFW
jgi:hypothetical protein